uniref:Uncharacterized protein n=1 Tax=Solanum lycopersicum TaxID=4081 RepID=A0A3Q7I211_SOLLC
MHLLNNLFCQYCKGSCYLLENYLIPLLSNKIDTCSQCHFIYLNSFSLAFVVRIFPKGFPFSFLSISIDTLSIDDLMSYQR